MKIFGTIDIKTISDPLEARITINIEQYFDDSYNRFTNGTIRTIVQDDPDLNGQFVFNGAPDKPGYFYDMDLKGEEGVKCTWEKLDQQLINHFSIKFMQLIDDEMLDMQLLDDPRKYADFIERQVVIPYGRHRNRLQLK